MQLKAISTLGTAVLLSCTIPTAYATNGYFAHGFGTKSKGMAGAGSALPQDAMISATNVAGIVWVGSRIDAGASLFSPHREYTERSSTNQFPAAAINAGLAPPWPSPVGSNPDFTGTVESEKNYFLIPHFAYARQLDDRSSVGAALYANGGMNTTYRASDTTKMPGTPAADGLGTFGGAYANPPGASTGVDLAQIALNLSYARKLTDNFSLGAGLLVAYQQFKAYGLTPFGQMVADGVPDALSNTGRDGVFGWGAQFGALWRINDQFSLGAAYQTKIYFNSFDKYSDLFAEHGDLDAPAFLNLGLAYAPREDLTFAVDVQHIWYSEIKALANSMSTPLLNCLAGQAQYCLGADDGPGYGWSDMTVYKFGVQWDYRPDLTLRAGYSYGDHPVPSEGVMFNTLAPAIIQHHFTAGFTKKLNKRAEISLAGMYAPRETVDCGCEVPFSGGPNSISIAMDQWELELSFGIHF